MPIHTAMHNCTSDERGKVGNHVLISSHRKLLSSKETESRTSPRLHPAQISTISKAAAHRRCPERVKMSRATHFVGTADLPQ
jgi:hypothetical protein